MDGMIIPRYDEIPGESTVPEILVGTILPQILVAFFLAGRIVSRVLVVGKWAWDDTLIVIAWIFALMVTVLLDISTLYGQGHHLGDVPFELVEESFKITYFGHLAYQLSLFFTKISILVFYLRVFPARREKWLTWGTIVFVALFSIPLLIGDILQCDPITEEPFIGGSTVCVDASPIATASAVLHSITGVWLIVMVIPVVMSLQIPRKQKWAMIGLLSLGIFVIIASIARIIVLHRIIDDPDVTGTIASFDIFSVLECCIGIICACTPTIRPLLQRAFPTFMASRTASGTRRTPQVTGKRESAVDSDSQSIRNKVSGPIHIERKDSWASDNGGEIKLVIKEGVVVRREELVSPNRPPSILQRDSTIGVAIGSGRGSLEEGLDELMRRKP